MKQVSRWLVSASLLALAMGTGCGKKKGGGSDGDSGGAAVTDVDSSRVTAADEELRLPGVLNLIPADDGTSLRLASYDDDAVSVQVEVGAMEPLDQVSSIFCFIEQTRFWENANKGAYQALVDDARCDNKQEGGGSSGGQGGQAGQGSQSQSQKARELRTFTANVTREPEKPMVVRFWIDGDEAKAEDDGGSRPLQGQIKVAAGPSDTNPVGIFRLEFQEYIGGEPAQKGFIESKSSKNADQVLLTLNFGGDDPHGKFELAAGMDLHVANDKVDIGRIVSKMGFEPKDENMGPGQKSEYSVVFNDAHLHQKAKMDDKEEEQCLDRKNFTRVAYQYGVYNTDGTVPQLNSGFSIEFERDGQVRQGWASYNGIWTNDGQGLDGIASVSKVNWNDGGKTVEDGYEVVNAPGKLFKMTRNTIKLGSLTGVDLSSYENGENSIVQWDGSKFVKTATMRYEEKGQTVEKIDPPVAFEGSEWGYNFYAESLSAPLNLPKTGLSNDFEVSYFAEELVSGGDIPSGDLLCFQNCPVMKPTADALKSQDWNNTALYQSSGSEFNPTSTESIAAPIATYTITAGFNLKQGSTEFQLPAVEVSQDQPSMYFSTGFLVPKSVWQAQGNKSTTGPWDLERKLDTYYRFNFGIDPWAKFSGLKKDGAFVRFDKPIEFLYTHSDANDLNGKAPEGTAGKSFRLGYGGEGQFFGIPWKQDPETGYGVPQFSIAAGVEVKSTDPKLRVKPTRLGLRLNQIDVGECGSIGFDAMPELPSGEPTLTIEKADKPEGPVRYIAGEPVGA